MVTRVLRNTVQLLLLTTLMSCSGDDTTNPAQLTPDGVASFDFMREGEPGTFEATGRFERDGDGFVIQQSFATGVDVTVPSMELAYYGIVAAAFQPPDLDALSILVSGQLAGEYPIMTGPECSELIQGGVEPCSSIAFDFQLSSNGSYAPDATSFEMISGTMIISSVADGRIQGTFSGVARQFENLYYDDNYLPDVEVEISEGSFDVPIVSLDFWNGIPGANPLLLAPIGDLMRD